MAEKQIHEGRNVKRIREILGIKQDVLAMELGLSQQAVSALEQKEALDREMLEKIAQVLKVSPEALRNFNEEAAVNYINNTYNDNASSFGHYYNFSPIDKLVEVMDENKKLYQALLKEKDDKIVLLERLLNKP